MGKDNYARCTNCGYAGYVYGVPSSSGLSAVFCPQCGLNNKLEYTQEVRMPKKNRRIFGHIRRYPLWYCIAFAVINLVEAIVIMLTLGIWGPEWILSFTRWYAKRTIMQRKAKRNNNHPAQHI